MSQLILLKKKLLMAQTGGVVPPGTQPSRVGSLVTAAGISGVHTLTMPASGISAGMLGIAVASAVLSIGDNPTVGLPSGYANVTGSPWSTNLGGAKNVLWVTYKYMLGNEESTEIAFTETGNGEICSLWGLYQNVHQTTPFESINPTGGSDDPTAFPVVTSSNTNRLGLALRGYSESVVFGDATGGSGPSWTKIGQINTSTGGDRACALYEATGFSAAVTSTGKSDATALEANSWNVAAFCLRPTGS